MLRKFLIKIGLILNLTQSFAAGALYQIDMLVFSYPLLNTTASNIFKKQPENVSGDISLSKINSQMSPYHLLPSHLSALKNESWALSRQSGYQLLLNYTWLQPKNNQKSVMIENNAFGWQANGTVRVRKNHYYTLDTELHFQSPYASFSFIKKQRLKPDVVYFFDHPHGGMLIKIHQIT